MSENFTLPDIIQNNCTIKPIAKSVNPHTVAFLSLLTNIDNPSISSLPIGFAVIQINGVNAEEFQVMQLSQLPIDKDRVIDGLMKVNNVLPFKHLYLDLETYRWLDTDSSYSDRVSFLRKDPKNRNVIFPMLNGVIREKDLSLRQLTAFNSVLREGMLTYLPALEKNEKLMASIKQIGISPLADALAGAIEQARIRQKEILFRAKQNNQKYQLPKIGY